MAQQLSTGKSFPTFQTTDIWGRSVSTQYTKGKTWWLFHRNIGCPACNVRIHQIQLFADALAEKGHRVILVLESQPDYIKSFVGDKPLNLTYVGDPDRKLYDLVGGQRSTLKLMNSLFHGMFKVVKEGEEIMGSSRKQDGHVNTIPSEFVVDQQGLIVLAHYSKFIGDDPELPTVKAIFSE
jgi:peroxiredoxin